MFADTTRSLPMNFSIAIQCKASSERYTDEIGHNCALFSLLRSKVVLSLRNLRAEGILATRDHLFFSRLNWKERDFTVDFYSQPCLASVDGSSEVHVRHIYIRVVQRCAPPCEDFLQGYRKGIRATPYVACDLLTQDKISEARRPIQSINVRHEW
jgi:hypothetical protein